MKNVSRARASNLSRQPWRMAIRGSFAALLVAISIVVMPVSVLAEPRLMLTVSAIDPGDFPWVTSYLTVVNENGYPVLGLQDTSFEVRENGQRATEFTVEPVVDSNEPLAAVVVLDVSGSMDAAAMADAKRAAAAFIERLRAQDKVSLFAFSTNVREIHPPSIDKGSLLAAMAALQPQGNTALFDALFAAVEGASTSGIARSIVVLETDGNDTSSKAALDDGINLARQKGVPVYVVGLGQNLDRNVLSRIASSTGGSALFAPTSSDLEQAYQQITDQLRGQYRLRYRSPAPRGSGDYQLSVTVSHGLDKATGAGAFVANVAPPAISGLTLADGAVVTEALPIAVTVQSSQPVRQMSVEVDGRVLAEVNAAPYTFTLEVAGLSGGQHSLTVKIIDAAGSTAERGVLFSVPAPTVLAEPIVVAANRQSAVAETGPAWPVLAAGTAAVGVAAAATAVVLWQRRKPVSAVPEIVCAVCGAKYTASEAQCPNCVASQLLAMEMDRTLGDVLVDNNLISREALNAALAESGRQGKRLEAILLDQGMISAAQLNQARFYLDHSLAIADRKRKLLTRIG